MARRPDRAAESPAPSRAASAARPRSVRGRAWLAAATAALALSAAMGGWLLYRPGVVSPAGERLGTLPRGVAPRDLNIVVLTLDTTRADKLGCYGEPERATPNLDALAEGGVRFDQAMAPVPLTLPAHSTLFTGTIPPAHGVRDNGGFVLGASSLTLASILKRGGWATGAFVAAFVLDSKWGLDRGFDRYADDFDLSKFSRVSLADVSRRGDEVVDKALPWLDEHASGRFFAWLHFYDPHSPYDAPEPYATRFARRPYLGEIAFMDLQVGRVLAWLDQRRLADRTIVVAIGDHGESLNEHREGTHGLFVYDSTLRVPFIVRAPYAGLAGRTVKSLVRSEDFMPTLLELAGVPVPPQVQGRSLVPLMNGSASDLQLDGYAETWYPRYHYGWSELRALRAGRYKYVEAPRPELYDLERDPGETTNLYTERKALAERLASRLEEIERGSGGPASSSSPTIDPETRERLAALGYIGTFSETPAAAGQQLADPKDKIDLFNLLLSAREGHESGAGGSSIETLERVIALDPNIIDAWTLLGNEHNRRDDPERALEAYRRALALKPDYDLATINMANTYRRLGRLDAAIAGYERYLERDPNNGYVHYQLGELHVDTARLDLAERSFRRALELDARLAAARNALGVVAFQRGDTAAAEREVRAALAQQPDLRLAHFNLALLAERRGDAATASAEYRREIELHPDSYKAQFNLGRLCDQLGDRQCQAAAYRRSIEINPRFAEGYFFLAKLYLDSGQSFDEAIRLARRGLDVGPGSAYAPLGHYVLADIYDRQGRRAEAAREAASGRRLEARSAPRSR